MTLQSNAPASDLEETLQHLYEIETKPLDLQEMTQNKFETACKQIENKLIGEIYNICTNLFKLEFIQQKDLLETHYEGLNIVFNLINTFKNSVKTAIKEKNGTYSTTKIPIDEINQTAEKRKQVLTKEININPTEDIQQNHTIKENITTIEAIDEPKEQITRIKALLEFCFNMGKSITQYISSGNIRIEANNDEFKLVILNENKEITNSIYFDTEIKQQQAILIEKGLEILKNKAQKIDEFNRQKTIAFLKNFEQIKNYNTQIDIGHWHREPKNT